MACTGCGEWWANRARGIPEWSRRRERDTGLLTCSRRWWTVSGAGQSSSAWPVSIWVGSSLPSSIGPLLTVTEISVRHSLLHPNTHTLSLFLSKINNLLKLPENRIRRSNQHQLENSFFQSLRNPINSSKIF